LTRLGRLRRLRALAWAALRAFGLAPASASPTEPRLTLIRDAGNVTYRVRVPQAFTGAEYLLRLHEPGYQSVEAITSELEWLVALCRDTDLGVPEPVRTPDGQLSVEVGVPGVPQPRRCSLLRWVSGRMRTRGFAPRHARAVGRLMAGLHEHAAGWQLPPGFTRPRYDWQGLFGDNDLVQVPAGEVWPRLPRRHRRSFERVTGELQRVMEAWGEGPEAFGLIHADVSVGANVLFGGDEARAIDFDDCAFGYWMFDLGVALSALRAGEGDLREALHGGYSEVRSLPREQWARLGLFGAAWYAFEVYWATAGMVRYPEAREAYARWAERAGGDLERVEAAGI
jgi:Ser/Thr protein kinase RdoA (MazF antagonist)